MSENLKARVEELVAQIPEGRVMTYGQLAALCGSPRAARIVGGIAHYGDPSLPWHRVVNKKGGLASGYHGGRHNQKEHLEAEGVEVLGEASIFYVNINSLIWWPSGRSPEDFSHKILDSSGAADEPA
jgi:methylated-DNA-protein-cysteine methyltransferase related protein